MWLCVIRTSVGNQGECCLFWNFQNSIKHFTGFLGCQTFFFKITAEGLDHDLITEDLVGYYSHLIANSNNLKISLILKYYFLNLTHSTQVPWGPFFLVPKIN